MCCGRANHCSQIPRVRGIGCAGRGGIAGRAFDRLAWRAAEGGRPHLWRANGAELYGHDVRFGQEELEILTFVSRQVASAIEHRRSQEALRKSEVRYRSQVQSAIYGIYRSSMDGTLPGRESGSGGDAGIRQQRTNCWRSTWRRDLYADKGSESAS